MGSLGSLKLTVLCENVVARLGIAEHGFAVFIETEGGAYLFDTGSGYGLAHNSRVFRKDLSSVRALFLSHGHYDHTGGLPLLLEGRGPLDVYGHPAIFDEKFAITREDGRELRRFIGMPHRRSMLESKGAVFHLHRQFFEYADGVYLTGEIPRVTDFEHADPTFFVRRGEAYEHDNLPDDQSAVFDTARGLVVLLGCAHTGIINTLLFIKEKLPGKDVYAVIGGTHLGFCPEDQRTRSIAALKDMGIPRLGVAHCTGLNVARVLMNQFGERCFYAAVGTSFQVP